MMSLSRCELSGARFDAAEGKITSEFETSRAGILEAFNKVDPVWCVELAENPRRSANLIQVPRRASGAGRVRRK